MTPGRFSFSKSPTHGLRANIIRAYLPLLLASHATYALLLFIIVCFCYSAAARWGCVDNWHWTHTNTHTLVCACLCTYSHIYVCAFLCEFNKIERKKIKAKENEAESTCRNKQQWKRTSQDLELVKLMLLMEWRHTLINACTYTRTYNRRHALANCISTCVSTHSVSECPSCLHINLMAVTVSRLPMHLTLILAHTFIQTFV